MKLSLRMLGEMVDLAGLAPEEVARLLTFHTAQVEDGIGTFGGGLDGVVTARVAAVRPHPNADRLRLCTVDRGTGEAVEVVCGAPNVAAGQVVCFAPVGTRLPNGVTLERRKIRGVESTGMICAEDELGLGTDHEGILVLDEGTPVGRPVGEVLALPDAVLEVGGTAITNRPDLWGHVGFARELGAILRRPFRPLAAAEAETALRAASGTAFPVRIDDLAGCRRYLAVVLEGAVHGPSPSWLRRRLQPLGQRSIDLLVDLTNLVMLEQGQPLHAFDLAKLRGGRVEVRSARPGERIRTLDGVDRALEPSDLVIADAERAVAIAGVMGGADTAVGPDTTAILLESATFDPGRIRRTAARLGLRSEASARFEKSLDPENARTALVRFVDLLLRSRPGSRVARPLSDLHPRPYPPVRISLPYDLVRRRLGVRVADADVRSILAALGFKVVREDHRELVVDAPSWRATKDVSTPEDLVEEVGRLKGYDHVAPVAPFSSMKPVAVPPLRRLERHAAAALSLDLGWTETRSRAFYGPKEADRLGIPASAHLAVVKPLSEEESLLLLSTAPNLLNQARRNQPFEASGRMWESTRLMVPAPQRGPLPEEVRVLGAVAWERDAADDPSGRLFLGLLEDLRAAWARVGVGGLTVRDATAEDRLRPSLPAPAWLHPGRRAVFLHGSRVVAIAGELLPSVQRAWDLAGRVAWGEADLEGLLLATRTGASAYQPVPRFPTTTFDVAVVVPRRTSAATLVAAILGATPEVVDAAVFDVFEGPGLPEGHRSLALTVTLSDAERTLSPEQSETLRRRIVAALDERGWRIRGAS